MPAETDVEGDVEVVVVADVESMNDAAEEGVLLGGFVPVGGDAVMDFGLDVERPPDGDAVASPDGGMAENTEGPFIEV